MKNKSNLALLSAFILCLLAGSSSSPGASRPLMGEQPDGSVSVPTNQTVTPIGRVAQIEGSRVKDVELSPDGKTLAVLTPDRVLLYTADGNLINHFPLEAGPLGLAWTPDSRTLFVSGDKGQVYHVAETEQGKWSAITSFVVDNLSKKPQADEAAEPGDTETELRPDPDARHLLKRVQKASKFTGDPQVTGLAVSPDGKRLYITLSKRNAVTVIDVATETLIATVPVGVAPFRIVVSPDGKTVFVANRGGRHPKKRDPVAWSAGTALRVDPKTDAALHGSISFIDTANFTAAEIDEGRQPAGLHLSHDGKTLFVANSDEDTVTMVNVATRRVVKSLSLEPAQDAGLGQMPTDLALSRDNKMLYVTCGGANAVALVSLPDFTLKGFLPTGWFPVAIAERDGELFVGSTKGIGARLRAKKATYHVPGLAPLIHENDFHVNGSISLLQFINETDRTDVAGLTKKVAANNHWNTPELEPRPNMPPVPVPARVGEPSVFKHVVYIIKENHTYDFDFGDIPQGNGDKSLCAFGEQITPNEHALARQFVLLDNSYTSGTNSADGHQWTDSAIANAYVEQNYFSYARSYSFNGTDPLAYSPNGFLWNAAMHAGESVRVYGEFVGKARITEEGKPVHATWTQLWDDYKTGAHKYDITASTDNAALRTCLNPTYVGFPLVVSDQWRADQFLAEFKKFEETDSLPALSILLLPSNHTSGAAPGMPTPRAAVADNDLAFGRIVDAISHSRFWADTLILAVEDDSLFALDHVDGHRMISFCVSPYTRRGAVVSEAYNHTSFVRTIGLVLGLPAMTRFDRTATPLTACFTDQVDLHPFTHLPNRVALNELNPPLAATHGKIRKLEKASGQLDWSAPDRANPTIVARAAWAEQRPGVPFPWKYFHPAVGDDDDD
jgi:YVTN family beta-propeller protein